ncbi:MAG: hypothetical protein WC989_01530 [Micavibrio sp.]
MPQRDIHIAFAHGLVFGNRPVFSIAAADIAQNINQDALDKFPVILGFAVVNPALKIFRPLAQRLGMVRGDVLRMFNVFFDNALVKESHIFRY